MPQVKIDVDTAQWAAESLANDALEHPSADGAAGQALAAIRMYDALKAAGYGSAVEHVLPQLARIAHVDL